MATAQRDKHFDELVLLANSAALNPVNWQWFVKELSSVAGGVPTALLSKDIDTNVSLGLVEHGLDPAQVQSYLEHYSALNPWTRAISDAARGQVIRHDALYPQEKLLRTQFYGEWLRPQNDITGGASVVLERNPARFSMLAGAIERNRKDAVEAPFAELLQRLVPFVQSALRVSKTLGALAVENRLLHEGMEPTETAVVALDANARIHFANTRAERLLDSGDIVRRDLRARLQFTDHQAQTALARALHDHFQPELAVSLPFFTGPVDHNWLCQTTPISERDGPLPWVAASGSHVTGFVLLMLTPAALRMRHEQALMTGR